MSHVYVRITGHGLFVLPHAPFRIERGGGRAETTLSVTRDERHADVDVLAILRGESGSDLVDVGPSARRGPFRLETKVFTCPWPDGFTLATDDAGSSAFLLLGPDESMIWIAGPFPREETWPIESKVVAEGQNVRAIADRGGDAYVDLDYVVDDELHYQRRYVIGWRADSTLVVSAQAPARAEDAIREAVESVADGLQPYRPD